MSNKNNKIEDTLSRRLFAEKIADEIANAHLDPDKENIIFAISGKWGTGKTRLLELINDILLRKGFSTVWFNPWQYSQEDISLKRAFLRTLKKDLNSEVNLDDLYYDRTKTEIDWILLIGIMIILPFLYFIILPKIISDEIFSYLQNFLKSGFGIALLTVLFIPIFLKIISLNKSSARISTAEEFEDKFKQLIEGNNKVVIFIDDLDRCTPKTVKTILDSLRTFLYHSNCSYVITGDHTVIERYAGNELDVQPAFRLRDKNDPDSERIIDEEVTAKKKIEEGRRFLKKLFDVYWRIPLPTPAKFSEFVENEIIKSNIVLSKQDKDEIKNIFIDDRFFGRNPRHVIRFLAALRFALESVQQRLKETEETTNKEELSDLELQNLSVEKDRLKDIIERPALLAKTLLIQELFYLLYEELCRNPSEIITHEREIRKNQPIDQLIIGGKQLKEIFIDKEEIELYANLVNRSPQFTDPNDSILYEAASFFSFSGFTGLPSTIGPDESKFLEYLKNGQLANKLMDSLKTTPSERNKKLVENALNTFDSSQDGNEKGQIILEALKVSKEIDDWANELPQWKEKIYGLPQDGQDKVKNNFIQAVLTKRPDLLDTINTEKPEFINEVWIILETAKNLEKFHRDTKEKIVKLAINGLDSTPPRLKPSELLLNMLDEKDLQKTVITTKIQNDLKDLDTAKSYLEQLKQQGLPNDRIYSIIKEELEKLIPQGINGVDWLVQNEALLSEFGLFDSPRDKIMGSRNQSKFFKKIVQYQQQLKLSEKQKLQLFDSLVKIIKKSSDLNILTDEIVYGFISDKERKKKTFKTLIEIVEDKNEKNIKRESATDLLKQENQLWTELTKEDVSELLKLLKQLRVGKELNKKKKEVLCSWNYEKNKKE